MKNFNLYFLIFISISTYAQVESVELFPENINDISALSISSPSMNDEGTRLCFKKKTLLQVIIMISDKSPEGEWLAPYPAVLFEKNDFFSGCAISANGDVIYFDLNNDIYRVSYLSEKAWSKPQLVGYPVSNPELMEAGPSISRNNKALSFIRNVRTNDRDMPWQLIPFVSQNIQKDEWTNPQKITIKELKTNEEVNAFYFDSENKNVFFSSGSSQNNWGNYYGLLNDSVCLNVKKMDFKGGYITWISKDYKTGLIITATRPSKIAIIKFNQSLISQMSLDKPKY